MEKEQLINWNQGIVEEFRANGGKVGGPFEGAPMMLVHTKGAKSGQARINPLVYSRDGERYVIIASYRGAPNNPDWYYNIVAHPTEVQVEVGDETFPVRVSVASGEERQRLFNQQAEAMPVFHEYQAKTKRQIPVIVLERL